MQKNILEENFIKMNNILERIIQISNNENITISKIERIIGASKGVLHKAIQNKTDISSKWIVLIAENFTQYNPDWLLTGKGEMLRENTNASPSATQLEIMADKINNQNKLISAMEEIAQLKKELSELKGIDNQKCG